MKKCRAKRIRVGIVGANPDRGWAAQAHIPALTSLPDDFEITARLLTIKS
jgi:predicted dehydrogenase